MDAELVLYEFIAMLVRISFQRANPTFGNFGDKAELVPLPGCLEAMLDQFVLPNARRDTSAQSSPYLPYCSPASPLPLPHTSPGATRRPSSAIPR